MDLLKTISTENEAIRFAIYRRKDGLFRVDEEKLQAGDQHTSKYWSFDQVGLFGTERDVASFLAAVAPRPTESWPG